MKVANKVKDNIDYIKNLNNSSDLITRIISNKIGYAFLESVSSDDKISNFLNKAISRLENFNNLYDELKNHIYNSNLSILDNLDDVFYYLANGFTIIFIHNSDKSIVVETRAHLDRGVVESSVEPVIRGPKDSFTENHPTNIGLIRKRIKDHNLLFQDLKIGTRSQTKVSIGYINGIANVDNVQRINSLIRKINIDAIIDTGYIREFLEKENTVFPKMISTERPDLVCSSLLNGKIIIMVENSPTILVLPGLFIDFIHSPEDYYQKPLNITFNRLLRLICFFVTLLVPALYISLMTYNQEIIPDELLVSLAAQREGIPFPTGLEVLIFVIVFEILREADLRSPKITGSAISIVGALILGDAAVAAGLVSPIVIIIVAITSISELVFYDIDMISAVREWRVIFIIASLLMGLIGVFVALFIFIIRLVSIETLGIPYLTPITPDYIKQWKDIIYRMPIRKLKDRPKFLTKNTKRMGSNEKGSI